MKFVACGEKATPASNDITNMVSSERVIREGSSYKPQKDKIFLSGDRKRGQIVL